MKKPSRDSSPKKGYPPPAFDPQLTLRSRPFEVPSLRADDDDGFELNFMEEVVEKDPCNEDALMLLGHAYTRRGEYKKGLDVDARLVRLRPADPTAYYNLACSYALLEQVDDAFAALEKAISLGYRQVQQLMKDPDLANLRKDPRFRRFLTRVFGRSVKDS